MKGMNWSVGGFGVMGKNLKPVLHHSSTPACSTPVIQYSKLVICLKGV
jgi:hypothetical protein